MMADRAGASRRARLFQARNVQPAFSAEPAILLISIARTLEGPGP